MKHYSFTPFTEIKQRDYLFNNNQWQEIYFISEDDGILLNGSWQCASKLYYDKIEPSFDI